jgi:subtilase family serine protease
VSIFSIKSVARHRRAGALALLGACSWFAIAGTAAAFQKAQVIGSPVASSQVIEFNIYLPTKNRAAREALLNELHTPGSPAYHQWLTPAQFNEQFGLPAHEVSAITHELAAKGLQVVAVHTNSLRVSGTVGAVNAAFGTTLASARFTSGGTVLAATSPMTMTPNLAAAGAIVMAFSGAVHIQSTAQKSAEALGPINPANRESPTGGYWFDDLKQAYGYPSYKVLTGAGAHIGVLMTPNFNPPDMRLYFSHEKLPTPSISTFNVEGGAPYDPNSAAETHIDITHSAGMAPKATVTLFNLPDLDDDSIIAGITDIIESNLVDVVNMSFGGPEAGYSPAYNNGVNYSGIIGIYDDLFAEGNALGITWVAASADWGGKDIPAPACFSANPPNPCGPMEVGVGIPAASPHVTAVGGTNLVTTYSPPSLNSAYVAENAQADVLAFDIFYGTTATGAVWGSGGGISSYFAKPSYQTQVSQQFLPAAARKWRTIPDVSLEMGGCPFGTLYYEINSVCPPNRSFDWTPISGSFYGYVGTSLSSPDFVGLVALKIQSEGSRLGNENYDIYALAAAQENGSPNTVFRQDIPGNNGVYKTYPGYNLVLGNGTVVANDFVRGPGLAVAGVPQTATNP